MDKISGTEKAAASGFSVKKSVFCTYPEIYFCANWRILSEVSSFWFLGFTRRSFYDIKRTVEVVC